jgi:hypothetical protein
MREAVLIRKSTGEIIKHDFYPNVDIVPIVGLDPDLEWLLKVTPYSEPPYDSRIYILLRTEKITQIPCEDYPFLNQYRITFSTVKRTNDDIKLAIENAETDANEAIVNYSQRVKILTLGLAVLFRKVDGLVLTNKEQNVADKIMAAGVKLWKNDATLKAKLKQVDDGIEPNIDEEWEKLP